MVKLADTLQAMSDFPVAMASGINIVKEDNTEKDLQQMYEDGELGGESMPMPLSANMLLVSENDETSGDLIWSQIDKSEVGSVPLICTEEEWEELDPKPVEGTEVIITDDEIDSNSLINDDVISEDTTWSSNKIDELCMPKAITTIADFHIEKIGKLVIANFDGCTLLTIKQNLQLPSKRYINTCVFNPKGTYLRRHGLIRLKSKGVDAWWHTGDGGETSANDNDRVWGSLIYILD